MPFFIFSLRYQRQQKYLILQAICAKSGEEPCCDWVGEDGSGHFVKVSLFRIFLILSISFWQGCTFQISYLYFHFLKVPFFFKE